MKLTKAQRRVADRKIAVLRLLGTQRTVVHDQDRRETVMSDVNVRDHTLYHLVEEKVEELWAHARKHLAEGLTVGGVWCLIEDLVDKVVDVLNTVEGSGEDKKELVILFVEDFYRVEIVNIDLPWVPNAIEGFIDKTIGEAIRPTVSWLIDKICAK